MNLDITFFPSTIFKIINNKSKYILIKFVLVNYLIELL